MTSQNVDGYLHLTENTPAVNTVTRDLTFIIFLALVRNLITYFYFFVHPGNTNIERKSM